MKKLSIPLDFFQDDRLQAAVQRHGILAELVALRVMMVIRRDGDAVRWTETLKLRICREVCGLDPDTADAIVADLVGWGLLPQSLTSEEVITNEEAITNEEVIMNNEELIVTPETTDPIVAAADAACRAGDVATLLVTHDVPKPVPEPEMTFNDIPVPFKEPKSWGYPMLVDELWDLVEARWYDYRWLSPTKDDIKQFFRFLDSHAVPLTESSQIPVVGFYRWLVARRDFSHLLPTPSVSNE